MVLLVQHCSGSFRDASGGAVGNNLEAVGYNLHRIGTLSIRSGGTVNLKLQGYDSDISKKLGRGSSNTHLHYIQGQIANITAGLAAAMALTLRFHQVGAYDLSRTSGGVIPAYSQVRSVGWSALALQTCLVHFEHE